MSCLPVGQLRLWAGLLSVTIGGRFVSMTVSIRVSCRFLDRLWGRVRVGTLGVRRRSRFVAAFFVVWVL